MKRFALLALALPLFAIADGDNPIEQRQHLMEQTRDALKPLIGMTRGQVDFNAETVTASLAVFENTAEEGPNYFPPGSDTGYDTEAKATIWTDRAGFDVAFMDFAAAVEAAQDANIDSVETLQPALQGILKTCKGCHDDFRVEKD